ncbi:MAG: radical SAM protein [Planctomycetes bacterium]|nr:radical SAM protein [Planctomycetota bacterium]
MLETLTQRLRAPLNALKFVANPWIRGRDEANHRAWERLPEELRRPDQIFGRQQPGCAATYHVMERCNFSCTACYLSNSANAVPPLSFEEVKEQLDAIRAYLGPWGNTQITAGEVTLLPVEDLIRILRYCHEIELSAMVMTHGETFRDDPTYLERLVSEGKLEKVAIHIDNTQRGRRGMPKNARERDLHFIRDEFAELIRNTRARTGRPLSAAHTFTVTEDNIDDVPDVMEWVLRNADAFRMISFQPTAAVGRTRVEALTKLKANRARLWRHVSEATGTSLNPQTLIFGHPDCNDTSLSFVIRFGDETQIVEVVRSGAGVDRAFFDRLFGGTFAGFSPDGMSIGEATARIVGRLLRQPRYAYEIPGYCLYRAFTERAWFPRFLAHVARGGEWSIHPFATIAHHFMSADELDTPTGRERLEACVFRLPVDGKMVSMCEMNGSGLRQELNVESTARRRLPQASGV